MSKYTPWFDAITEGPAHVGVYEVKHVMFIRVNNWSYWDGMHWHLLEDTAERAAFHAETRLRSAIMHSKDYKPRWRGLTKKGGAE